MSRKYLIDEEQLRDFIRAEHEHLYHYYKWKHGEEWCEANCIREEMDEDEVTNELRFYDFIDEE